MNLPQQTNQFYFLLYLIRVNDMDIKATNTCSVGKFFIEVFNKNDELMYRTEEQSNILTNNYKSTKNLTNVVTYSNGTTGTGGNVNNTTYSIGVGFGVGEVSPTDTQFFATFTTDDANYSKNRVEIDKRSFGDTISSNNSLETREINGVKYDVVTSTATYKIANTNNYLVGKPITEIGMGKFMSHFSSTMDYYLLHSHALIKNSQGENQSIVLLDGEYLKITYTVYTYINRTPTIGDITIKDPLTGEDKVYEYRISIIGDSLTQGHAYDYTYHSISYFATKDYDKDFTDDEEFDNFCNVLFDKGYVSQNTVGFSHGADEHVNVTDTDEFYSKIIMGAELGNTDILSKTIDGLQLNAFKGCRISTGPSPNIKWFVLALREKETKDYLWIPYTHKTIMRVSAKVTLNQAPE